eukprot:9870043-Ditylum_brightwellii.AAC.1
MGFPEPQRRRDAVCMEKFLAAMCSYEKKKLEIRINTRAMEVDMILMKLAAMTKEIQHWHKEKKSFNIRYKKHEQCIKSKKISSDDELKAHLLRTMQQK